jgi:hypothetical protein
LSALHLLLVDRHDHGAIRVSSIVTGERKARSSAMLESSQSGEAHHPAPHRIRSERVIQRYAVDGWRFIRGALSTRTPDEIAHYLGETETDGDVPLVG